MKTLVQRVVLGVLALVLAETPALAETAAGGGEGLWYKGLIALAAGLGLGSRRSAPRSPRGARRRRRWNRSGAIPIRPIASSRRSSWASRSWRRSRSTRS